MEKFFILLVGSTLWCSPAYSADHWTPPIYGGGSRLAELLPTTCGQCHPDKLAEWSPSRHAHAFSPGLLGQLLTFSSCQETLDCLKCHAPLAEQQEPWTRCADLNHGTTPRLAATGVTCAGCHMRQGQIVAPTTEHSSPSQAHPGMQREPWFRHSTFCRACHQFPQELAVNGKPVQNTFTEWQASRFAAQGITCQTCHMPDGRHLFRGIHDPSMVASGLEVQGEEDGEGGVYTVRSTNIGHAFPTYIVPRVILDGQLMDATGKEVAGGHRQLILQRLLEQQGDLLQERTDTRLFPGEEARLRVPWQVAGKWGNQIRFRLLIEPDYYYQTQVFNRLPTAGKVGELIGQAQKQATAGRFTLFEKNVVRTGEAAITPPPP